MNAKNLIFFPHKLGLSSKKAITLNLESFRDASNWVPAAPAPYIPIELLIFLFFEYFITKSLIKILMKKIKDVEIK